MGDTVRTRASASPDAAPTTQAPASNEAPATTEVPATTATSNVTAPSELQPSQFWTEQGLPQAEPGEDDADSALGDNNSSTASLSSSILHYRTINGRTFHSERGNAQYWAPNDDQQNDTLDIQHHVYTVMQDGKLFYAPLGDKIGKVLDIGTGTGIWAIDMGDEHPEAEIIGTDVSPIQPDWLPPNVRFEIDDFTQEWTFEPNSLDYVHMRFLIGSVTDWDALFAQAFKVLKPGGWVESLDNDGFFSCDDDTMPPTSAMGQWGGVFKEGAKAMGLKASFAIISEGLQRKGLERAGFVNIQEKLHKIPVSAWPKAAKEKQVGQFTGAAMCNDTEGTVGLFAGALGWSKEEILIYSAHARKEVREKKIHAYYQANAAWAQKPYDA